MTGLKNTIAALRQELKQFDGINPEEARQALTQLPQLQTTNQTLSQQVNQGKIDSAITQAIGGVLPQYSPLLSTNARGLLQVNDQGEVVSSDGRSIADINAQFRQQYPAMFTADAPTGSGATASTSAAAPPSSVVTAPNGIISGVDPDRIIDGSVQIQV